MACGLRNACDKASPFEKPATFGCFVSARPETVKFVLLKGVFAAERSAAASAGTVPTTGDEAKGKDVEETRRYILSRRIERSPKVRKDVLKAKPPICESCGLDPKRDYGFVGRPQETPLDVHHARPIRGLAEGETRRYRIPDDFMVLCPTCHRMIHKIDDPSDLLKLRQMLRFKIARDVSYFSP